MRPSTLIPALLLMAAMAAAFAGVRHNELVDWDDVHLLVANDRYQGLSGEHLRWMVATTLGGHYQPLTWLSYAADYAVWGGVSASGIHLTNLVLHLVTAGLFFLVAQRLIAAGRSGDSGDSAVAVGAFTAALLFAVHPLRVESVAWATERRDVLSGALLMASVLLYLRFTAYGRHGALAASVGVFGLSLLSKAAGITLPFVLLTIDWFPLRRVGAPTAATPSGNQCAGRRIPSRRAAMEKAGFFVVGGIVAGVALYAQWRSGALRTAEEHPLGLRLSQAAYGIVFYLGKMLWPVDLIPLYEQDPGATSLDPKFLLCGGVVAAISVIAWVLRKRVPGLGAAWLSYVLLLAPVLGLAQSGPQIAADRYTYLASMPWAVLAGGVVARFWTGSAAALQTRTHRRRGFIAAGLGALGLGFVLLTRAQVGAWKDSYTLWTTVIERAPQTGLAHANLSSLLLAGGDVERAREHARAALDRLPGNRLAHNVLGRASAALGDYATAERHLVFALQIAEGAGSADTAAAVALAGALTGLGRLEEAEKLYRQVILAEPGEAEWCVAYAGFLAGRERSEEAIVQLQAALRLDDTRSDAWARMGILLRKRGRWAESRDSFERGLARLPQEPRLQVELAWLLATCPDESIRDGGEALALARAALQSVGDSWPRAHEALAAALAETGDFAAATEVLSKSLPQAETATQRERMESQLASYRERRAYREP